MRLYRFAALSGVVAVVLVVISFAALGQDTPGIKSSPEKVAAFYDAHSGREQGASYLAAIAIFFLVVYGASLWARLRASTSAVVWPNVAFAGCILGALGLGVGATIHLALADGADHPAVVLQALQALNVLDNDSYLPFASPFGVMLLGAAGAWVGAAGAARWFGWIALVLGILVFTPLGFFGFLGAGLWILATSIYFFVTRERAPHEPPIPEAVTT